MNTNTYLYYSIDCVCSIFLLYDNIVSLLLLCACVLVVMACWVGAILIGCTFISAVLMIPIDAKLDLLVAKEEEEEAEEEEKKKLLLLHSSDDSDATTTPSVLVDEDTKDNSGDALHMSDVFKLPYVFQVITVTVILVYGKRCLSVITL